MQSDGMPEAALTSTLVVVLAGAVWTDLRGRRIPNWLTGAALLVAIAIRAAVGPALVLDGLLGAGLGLLVMLPLFAMGGVGGGDAKLLIAVGAFLGPWPLVLALVATAIAGGVISLVYAAWRGTLIPLVLNTRALLVNVLTVGRAGERRTLESAGSVSIPYALAIATGTLFSVWYGMGA
jgi:prepilin peptidase CpaA